jgi:superoxide dismutase, Cu-Zn family
MQPSLLMKTTRISFAACLAFAACKQTGSASGPDEPEAAEMEQTNDTEEGAVGSVLVPIQAKSGSQLEGTATLNATNGTVRIVVDISNAPSGAHGLHIHEKADCSADDASSAGGHFSPDGDKHGLPKEDDTHHLGDLGNIDVNEEGHGNKIVRVEGVNLTPGDPRSLLGRAIMIHAKKDDGGQPTGNAGARIGCGEIETPKDTPAS